MKERKRRYKELNFVWRQNNYESNKEGKWEMFHHCYTTLMIFHSFHELDFIK